MINTQHLIWSDLSATNHVPKIVQTWLRDDESLTAKLKQKFADFEVRVLLQEKQTPHQHERLIITNTDNYVVREVALLGDGVAMVFARSVIPLTNDTQDLLNIGSKPLGEVLFNDATIERGKLEITQTADIWGRRSTFTVGTTRLLVSEFFLASLYA